MRILVVEDNPERNKWFKSIFPMADFAIDAETGVKCVTENVYDSIFLDHDLGDRVFVDSEDMNTGFQVAKKIKETENMNAQIIVHSLNPTGAQNIKGILPQAQIVPFFELRNNIRIKI